MKMIPVLFGVLPLLAAECHLLAPNDPLHSGTALPQIPVKTVVLHHPKAGGWQYSHHASITWYKDRFFAIWSNGRRDEDSSSQIVRYATSRDGLHWSAPEVLAPDPDGESGPLRRTAGGFWHRNGELYVWAITNTTVKYAGAPAQKETWKDLGAELFRWTGARWIDTGTRIDNFMDNQGPYPMSKGGYLWVGQDSYAAITFMLGGTASVTDWKRVHIPDAGPGIELSEPSWYEDPMGTLHVLIRDDAGSHRLFCSESTDGGITWSKPIRSDMPDARSKFYAGRLKDGRYFLVHDPNPKMRIPLVISLREPGKLFSKSWIIRSKPTTPRFPGMHKDAGYEYPNATEHDGRLYVIYSVNKEDIAVSVIDVPELK